MSYRANIAEFQFLLEHVVGFDEVMQSGGFPDLEPEVVTAILSEAGRLCETVLAPLQRNGDLDGATLENGVVRTARGFAEGYRAIAEGGWIGIAADPEYGGMGLPQTLATVVNDMMSASCLALQLNPLMTQGQIDALTHHASDEMKRLYLPRLVSGEWSGTMNLTEPQAGSDVGALKTAAVPADDGTFRVTGQKIFISWGDNDFTENVCHLVLARLPGAPAGTRGISLFMVPKFIPDDAGRPGKRNGVRVISLEHKLGLHGSPTAVMEFDGAVGWMVGEPHSGLKAMFTMMNNARLGVGVEGIGQAEGALQQAVAYAAERRQGKPASGSGGPIIDHADVRRMLATMRADTLAARSIALACAVAIDMARATGNADWAARAAFLTPIAKAFGTDVGCEVANLGIQVHGGMGYIEETGAAQFARDVRVTAIYEGTNGIQAADLVGRKLADGGETASRLIDEVEATADAAKVQWPGLAEDTWAAAENLREVTEWLVAQGDPNEKLAGATAYLRAFARVLGAHFHLRAALGAGPDSPQARLAAFYVSRHLPEHQALLAQVRSGAAVVMDVTSADLGA